MYGRVQITIMLRLLLVLTICSFGLCKNFKILLLHTSDMHSRYDEVNIHTGRCQTDHCYGGFARLRAEVNRLKKEAEKKGIPAIYLDAGDVFGESVYNKEFGSSLALLMMNQLTPDAMSIGNHEFDGGLGELRHYLQYSYSPIVCTNIDASDEPLMMNLGKKIISPSTVLNVNGIKIGIVGYISPRIPSDKIGNLKILDEIKSLSDEARRLKEEEKVNVVIALGHAGYYRDMEIAKEVDNIDVIVGGGSHFFLYSGWKRPSIEKPDGPYPTIVKKGNKKIPILHASYGTKYLGQIELEFNDKGDVVKYTGQPILLKWDKPQDEKIVDALATYKDSIKTKYQVTLGNTLVIFNGKDSVCRFQECNIGNLITDAFREGMNKRYRTPDGQPPAHIAIIHSGDISASLYPKSKDYSGDITLEDLIEVLPFSRQLVVLKLQGGVLRQLLEDAMNTYDPEKGGLFKACLMQVSGLRLQYDLTKIQGRRLTGVQVDLFKEGYKDLDDKFFYNVVMPDFLANGGDEFCSTKLKGEIRYQLPGYLVDSFIVGEHIKRHTPLTGDDYKLSRITIIEPKTSKSSWSFISSYIKSIRERVKRIMRDIGFYTYIIFSRL